MGMKSSTPGTAAATPVVPTPRAIPSPATPAVEGKKKEVKGQVAMHAIITGYEVASHLAATLAASPEKVEEKLHKLALEVAAQVEAYTFKD